jgi:glutamate synthase (NADPH/NADH) small chain
MGNPIAFISRSKIPQDSIDPKKRVKNYKEFVKILDDTKVSLQGSRCMDCGIPFCQTGCPVSNVIPDWNDLVYKKNWEQAYSALSATNNFPEFTGRICPAPCEASCTLNINDDPVGIKSIEQAIAEKAWNLGLVKPIISKIKINKKVAIIGSGPAGLACAQQLVRKGYQVTVYEKNDRLGGLLRYGIPDFKLDKKLVDRRIDQLKKEGVKFKISHCIGSPTDSLNNLHAPKIKFVDPENLIKLFDAVVLAIGAENPRPMPIPGGDLDGIYPAMEFLPLQNKRVSGDVKVSELSATGKHVVVIGGGDTGSDCVGTSNRQKAKSVTQLELLNIPPERENKLTTWPNWPLKLRTSSSHEEGCERQWGVLTKEFRGKNGKVTELVAKKVEHTFENNKMVTKEIPNSTFSIKADLVLLAMGFVGPTSLNVLNSLKLKKDARTNIDASYETFKTSKDKVFATGDCRRGQSLVVWAIDEGRRCAEQVNNFLNS